MGRWTEVTDGVFHRRYDPYDVGVGVVRGDSGLLVVDTRSSHREADELLADLRELGRPVRAVVNTHAHFDHTFGNHRFGANSQVGAPIYGHRRLPGHLDRYERPDLAEAVARAGPEAAALGEVVITPPTVLVDDSTVVDLGDRAVALVHLGRGHTDHDLVLHVADAGAWLAGDLVEESGPPAYGPDCYPLEWPDTVRELTARLEPDAIVVPGHGAAVTPAFVARQEAGLREVALVVRELHAAGVPADAALAAGADRWPFPAEALASAVAEGYRHLGASGPRADGEHPPRR